jgi:dTDP-glucose pyrophosphorylase
MRDLKSNLLEPTATIGEAIAVIEASAVKIALVVDAEHRLLGTITDGDVRRGFLKGLGLESPASDVMNASPITAQNGDSLETFGALMARTYRRQLPLLDEQNRVVGLVDESDFSEPVSRENLVFVLAGGLGTRLRPLTEAQPKPMLAVGGKPILQRILESFIGAGFSNFCFSLGYRGEQIREYFGDGGRWNVSIDYVEETEPLGTAGPLGLISRRPNHPVLVINGDVLTEMNFQHLLDFHMESGADATICARAYHFEIPFGVMELDGQGVVAISEKPTVDVLVNAGIYCLGPEVVDRIRAKTGRSDMPDMLREAIDAKQRVSAFPIHEYWIDVGRLNDLERAQLDLDERT